MDTILALLVFFICYIGFIVEKINRAIIACAGGIVLFLFGIVELDAAFFKHIDWHTIALLFSMMILVSITSQNGVFEYVSISLAKKVGGYPVPLLMIIAWLTAFGSALLDNVTTVLLIVPIVLTLTKLMNMDAVPFLTAVILSSNIGGTATMIGDPPNIMIGQAVPDLEFNDFLINLGTPVFIIFVFVTLIMTVVFRHRLQVHEQDRLKLLAIDPARYLKKGPLLYKSLAVLAMTLAGFLLHPFLHVELTAVAMAGAMLLMLLTHHEQRAEDVFKSVEWVTLFFFIGLFILIGGLKEVGIIDEMARSIVYVTEGDLPQATFLVLWGSGILSSFLDNIPFVAAMIPVIMEFQDYGMTDLDPLWWALALGACLGGNGTLIGASANVIVAGFAVREKIPFHFFDFLKVGMGVVVLSLLISTIYLYVRYLSVYFH